MLEQVQKKICQQRYIDINLQTDAKIVNRAISNDIRHISMDKNICTVISFVFFFPQRQSAGLLNSSKIVKSEDYSEECYRQNIPNFFFPGISMKPQFSKIKDDQHFLVEEDTVYKGVMWKPSCMTNTRTRLIRSKLHKCLCVHAQSHPMDRNLPDSSVHGILQAIMEWVAISFSRGSS